MIHKAMRDRARQLRADATPFELAFWRQVRAGRLGGYKFRRQQVIGPYIADFVCQQAKLIVELDGAHHQESREYDARRDEWLRAEGYRVLRVWNNEWTVEPGAVLETVLGMLQAPSPQQPSPQPLPPNGGGASTTLAPAPTPSPLSPWGRGAGGEGGAGWETSL